MIGKEKEFLFINVPKTGTTSMLQVLEGTVGYFPKDANLRHGKATEWRDYFKEKNWDWDAVPFKFGFVRSPFDWILSQYNYMKKVVLREDIVKKTDWDELCRNVQKVGMVDFEKWILNKDAAIGFSKLSLREGRFKTQSSFLCDSDGTLLVDFVGRFENLEEDFHKVCNQIEPCWKPELPKINISNKDFSITLDDIDTRPYQEQYSEEMIEIVRERYEEDLERFGYEFGQ